tara:strand:- start:110 stop:298 length:189 start_codon:yes stop_codon:yes gene_type:complete
MFFYQFPQELIGELLKKRNKITRDRAKKPIISGKYLTGLTMTTYNSVLNNDYGSIRSSFSIQ